MKACAYFGCPRLSHGRYCDEHTKIMNRNYNRYSRDKKIIKQYGTSWQKIRARYVKKHPFCEECLKKGIIKLVEEVHHILPLARGGTHREDNLMSLCRSCHNKMHHELGDR